MQKNRFDFQIKKINLSVEVSYSIEGEYVDILKVYLSY